MGTESWGTRYSPPLLVTVSARTPVASFVIVTFPPASTAPLESATRPRMRPPVLWADTNVEKIRHRLRIENERTIQRDVRDGFNVGIAPIGMGQILQISRAILLDFEFSLRTIQTLL